MIIHHKGEISIRVTPFRRSYLVVRFSVSVPSFVTIIVDTKNNNLKKERKETEKKKN